MSYQGSKKLHTVVLATIIYAALVAAPGAGKATTSVSTYLEPAKNLVDILVSDVRNGTRVVLIGDGHLMNYKRFELKNPSRIVIDLPGMAKLLPKNRLRVNSAHLKQIRIGQHRDRLRLALDVDPGTLRAYNVKEMGNKLILLMGEDYAPAEKGSASPPDITARQERTDNSPVSQGSLSPVTAVALSKNPVSGKKQVSAKETAPKLSMEVPSKTKPAMADPTVEQFQSRIRTGTEPGRVYTGEKISLDFHDIDIRNVFKILQDISGLNYIIDPKVKGRVTMSLKEVPWDQALDLVIATNKLGMIREGNVIRIAPLADLRKEEQEIKRMREAALKARLAAKKAREEAALEAQKRAKELVPLQRKTIQVNYASAKDMEKKFKKFLGKRGQIFSDERTNTVTVIDIPENIKTIEELIKRIDQPTPQVLIEARIIAASSTFSRGLGIQWGLGYETLISGRTNKDWVVRTGDFTVDYTAGTPPTRTITATPFGIDFPVVAPAAVGFSFAKLLGDVFQIDLRITAAEDRGEVKTLSRPKIVTFDNVEAFITQGTEIPFQQQTAEGVPTIVFKKAAIELKVTPHITPDGKVKMKVDVKEDEIGTPVPVGALGTAPTISIRQANTELMVESGSTIVIGGVYRQRESKTTAGVPGLMEVPVLSWLFKNKTKSINKDELLIFLTPFIIREGRKT